MIKVDTWTYILLNSEKFNSVSLSQVGTETIKKSFKHDNRTDVRWFILQSDRSIGENGAVSRETVVHGCLYTYSLSCRFYLWMINILADKMRFDALKSGLSQVGLVESGETKWHLFYFIVFCFWQIVFVFFCWILLILKNTESSSFPPLLKLNKYIYFWRKGHHCPR